MPRKSVCWIARVKSGRRARSWERPTTRCSARLHAPDDVADVVGHEQATAAVDGDADGPAARLAALVDEAREHVDVGTGRLAALEGHEHHFVAGGGLAIPGAVQADVHAFAER